MSCNLEQALNTVRELLELPAIQKNIPFEIRRVEFEIKAMMAAKDKMLNGSNVSPYDNKLKETSKKATPEFDTLPKYLPGQNNMTYAGIGSRETPMEVLELMTKASAWLGAKGYTLQSGGAIGADMAFEGKPYPKTLTAGSYDVVNKKGKVVLKAGQVVKIGSKKYTDAYYAFTDKSTKGSIVGSDWSEKVNVPNTKSFSSFDVVNNKFGNANKVKIIANELHPSSDGMNQWVEALMARNTYQIFGSNLDTPVDFVLFYAKEGKGIRPEGGTGQAVEMARLKGIPTVNMADGDWRAQLTAVLKGDKSTNKVDANLVKEQTKQLNPKFKGKFILAHAGIGKSYAVQYNSNLIDGDDLFTEAANEVVTKYNKSLNEDVQTIPNVSKMKSIFTAWGEYSTDIKKVQEAKKRREEVYQLYADKAQQLMKQGKTILSSSARPATIKIADYVIVQDNTELIKTNLQSDLRINKNSETDTNKIKEKINKFNQVALDNKIPLIKLSSQEFLSDILYSKDTTKSKPKDEDYVKQTKQQEISTESASDENDKFVVSESITSLKGNQIFVFGANAQGVHGKGSALQARKFGTLNGEAVNSLSGNGKTWGIVTKESPYGSKVSRENLIANTKKLLKYASMPENANKEFLFTAIGTGLAGFTAEDVLEAIGDVNKYSNIKFPAQWKTIYENKEKETTYEVSSKGDKDYSALYAKLEDGRSIEEHYQVDVKSYKTWKDGKGKPPKDTSKNLQEEYAKLWKRYFELNPNKYEFIKEKVNNGVKLTDEFATKNGVNQADTIMQIVNSKWEPKKRVDTEDKTSKKATPENENFDKDLDTKLRDTLTKLYPEIKLEYTEDEIQYIDSNGNVMNQEEASNLVNYTLKVVDTLYDIGTPKKSKHGGNSQPVRSTIKLNSKENPNIEVNLTKYLAGKGVSKEQIEYMFEYMRQNNISEIGTLDLAERLLFGLTQNVEIKTAQFLTDNIPEDIARELIESGDVSKDKLYTNTNYYKSLTVPGGTNYKEIEVVIPNVAAYLKGHAEFASDEGIGWYRVDEITEADPLRDYDSEDFVDMFKAHEEQEATRTKTLRVLEMQSDMFQKEKNSDLTKGQFENTDNELAALFGSTKKSSDTNLNMAFNQILNTDNKWVKFFIKSIVQNAERNGYEKIRFPAGETVAKIEGHDTLADIIRKKEKKLLDINNAIPKKTVELEKAKTSNNTYKIELLTKTLKELKEEKAKITKELEENSLEKLAPIEGFYQVRVQNTLKKEYGADKVKTVTDEHGNKWFELELDSKRDSQAIMLQQQGGKIKGQANIEAGTVLINSLLQSQDTLPHEYAHHYIAWFRDTQIVQEAIKKWGSEEALVQAIGEQVVKQKGEAYGWWKKFSQWLQNIFDSQSDKSKESIKNLLTDSFLTRQNLKESSAYEDEKIKKPDSGYKTSETELALDEYLASDLTPEASTKSEDSIINVEKVGKQSTKDKLNLLLKAYDSASGITIGGGYVENMQVKDGYRVSDMDEDVKKGTIEKGMYQESVADLLPKLDKRVSTYLKSYDKYYNELNRTTGVRRDIEYLLDILDKVSSEPYIADAVGIKVEEDVLIQEDTPINELIKDGIHCKNKG